VPPVTASAILFVLSGVAVAAVIKTHVARVLIKLGVGVGVGVGLGVRDRVQAVIFAYKSGVVAPG
jgi:hypothetical protein